jgi:hypothetical protein
VILYENKRICRHERIQEITRFQDFSPVGGNGNASRVYQFSGFSSEISGFYPSIQL